MAKILNIPGVRKFSEVSALNVIAAATAGSPGKIRIMNQIAKTANSLMLAASIFGALSLLCIAQEQSVKEPAAASAQTEMVKKSVDAPKKRSAAKKKVVKKRKAAPPEPASEYKFQTQDAQPAYTFDKKGDPIAKKAAIAQKGSKKSGKITAGGAKLHAGQPLPKLNNAGKDAQENSAVRYVCPMGEYEGDKPGKCPKCGMTLVEKK